MQGSWFEQFVPYSMFHLATVAILAALMLGACGLGHCFRCGTRREVLFRQIWGWFILAFQVFVTVWWILPDNYDRTTSWPLQLCDLAAFVAGVAMITGWRATRSLLYFWGIGLSTQAFFSPIVHSGLAHVHFWLFWIGHTVIVGSAVYDLVIGGFRPSAADFKIAFAITLSWAIAMAIMDPIVGVNYGYLGPNKPSAPSIVDYLGPWPWRVPVMMGIVMLEFFILWRIWPSARRSRPARFTPTPHPGST